MKGGSCGQEDLRKLEWRRSDSGVLWIKKPMTALDKEWKDISKHASYGFGRRQRGFKDGGKSSSLEIFKGVSRKKEYKDILGTKSYVDALDGK
ncbi:hypothetical protein AgCh_018221 [Apium graveolens]